MNVGAKVIVRGRGLGVVTAITDGVIRVTESDLKPGEESIWEASPDAVRPLVSRPEAERLIAILGNPGPRLPTEDRALAYRRAIKSGDLEEQAKLLAASYTGDAETPEIQYQERLEDSVYRELAIVLDISRKALRAKIRSARRGEAAPRSLALADRSAELAFELPPLDGYEP